MRQTLSAIFDRIYFLRANETKGDKPRQQLIDYVAKQIEKLKASCDQPRGYSDPGDPFADCALDLLESAFSDLTRPGNPYPIKQDSG